MQSGIGPQVGDVGFRITCKPKYNDGTNPDVEYMDFSGDGVTAQLIAISPTPACVRKVFNLTISATGNAAYYITQDATDFDVNGAWTMEVLVFSGSVNPIHSKRWTMLVEPSS